MIETTVKIYTKAEKKPEDYESVIVFFGDHRAPDWYDPMEGDFHFYGSLMKPTDKWMSFPEEINDMN